MPDQSEWDALRVAAFAVLFGFLLALLSAAFDGWPWGLAVWLPFAVAFVVWAWRDMRGAQNRSEEPDAEGGNNDEPV